MQYLKITYATPQFKSNNIKSIMQHQPVNPMKHLKSPRATSKRAKFAAGHCDNIELASAHRKHSNWPSTITKSRFLAIAHLRDYNTHFSNLRREKVMELSFFALIFNLHLAFSILPITGKVRHHQRRATVRLDQGCRAMRAVVAG